MTDQIRQKLAAGESKEEIYLFFLNNGYKVDAITAYFSEINSAKNHVDSRKQTIQAVVIIGSLLIAAGIFSFIAANWQAMTSGVKISIIIISLLTSYLASWYLESKENHITSRALVLLGSLIFGSGIFLIGQIFHVRANWPDGFIIWMLGLLPLGILVKNNSVLVLAAIVGTISLFGHPMETFTPSRVDFLPVSTSLLFVAFIATYGVGAYLKNFKKS